MPRRCEFEELPECDADRVRDLVETRAPSECQLVGARRPHEYRRHAARLLDALRRVSDVGA